MQNPHDHFLTQPAAYLELGLDEETLAALDAICVDTSHTRTQVLIALIWYVYGEDA